MNVISNLLIASALVGVPSVLGQSSVNKENEIPTIAFCEMVRHPERYFDRTIRISATMELGDEGSNLNDVRCVRSHDDSIGVSAVPREQQGKSFQKDFEKIRDGKWDGQPRVNAIGILRNKSLRAFAWYRYRFDIISFEDIHRDVAETIITYGGTLRAGLTYRAMVRRDEEFGLSFESSLRVPIHQAARPEWINLKEFPVLKKLRGLDQRQFIFRVESDDIHEMGQRRWDRILRLKILMVE